MTEKNVFPVTKGEKYVLPVSVAGDERGGWRKLGSPCSGLCVSIGDEGVLLSDDELGELGYRRTEDGEGQ